MKNTNNTPITIQELLQKNKIPLSAKAKDFSSSGFWYYTSMQTVDSILQSGKIWVSNLASMNDIREAELHSQDKERVHALCFCNSSTEKIPMWYLYSGICGKGMRMGLTPAKMRSFLQSICRIYPVTESVDENNPLILGKDFLLEYGWVFYKKSGGIVKHKGKWYNVQDYENFEYQNYFVKDYPWEYEKEFRIVFINKTENKYKRIAVEIPEELFKKLKLSYAPEVDYTKEILDKEGFQRYLQNKISASELSIKMDLLSRNKNDIVKNIETLIDEKNAKYVCGAIQSQRTCAKLSGAG